MIRLVEGQRNSINVFVASSIDITGFSLEISFTSVVKTIQNIQDGKTYIIELSAEEVDEIPSDTIFCSVVVLNNKGKVYQYGYVKVGKVPPEDWYKVMDYVNMAVTIVANWTGGSGGGGGDLSNYVTKEQLQEAREEDRGYTDTKVSDRLKGDGSPEDSTIFLYTGDTP